MRRSLTSTTDPIFLGTLESWLHNQPEVLVLIRYSYAAGSREFRLFTSLGDFSEALRQLPHLASVIVFRQPQLPIRGVVDDAFIAKCLQNISNGTEYLVTETVRRVYGHGSWFHYGSGVSHAELRDDLEECRGAPVAAGLYPAWLEDTKDVISAVVPDEHGIVKSGIY
jgi:hypothetical protein